MDISDRKCAHLMPSVDGHAHKQLHSVSYVRRAWFSIGVSVMLAENPTAVSTVAKLLCSCKTTVSSFTLEEAYLASLHLRSFLTEVTNQGYDSTKLFGS